MSDGTVNVGSAPSGLCCIAGLGNPGIRYARTPHNIGFWVLDEVAERSGIRISKTESGALIGTGKVQDRDVVLVKPQTFMNNSGEPLASVLRFRKLAPEDLIVVHDQLDLPWTALRIKIGGSAAGHNGIKSIISSLKADCFTRVRVGIRPDHKIVDAADYVLAPLERELKVDEEEIVSYTANAIESIVAEGANKAMTKFNRRARGNKEEEE
jgi:peptidyl-tRNA hydrolase, PTH1 family